MSAAAASPTIEPIAAAPHPIRRERRRLLIGWLLALGAILFIAWNAGWENFLNYLVLGLPQGAIIAMIAMGYSMVYGIIQLINFAHGEIFMFSAFLTLALLVPGGWESGGQIWPRALIILAGVLAFTCATTFWVLFEEKIRNPWTRGAAAAAVAAAAGFALHALFRMPVPFFAALAISALLTPTIGITMDRVAYRPLRRAPRLIPLITAIGVSIFLMNLAQFIFGTSDYRYPDDRVPAFLTPYFPAWDEPEPEGFWQTIKVTRTIPLTELVNVPLLDVIVFALALAMMTAVNFFVQKTKTGTAMRACALDQTMARLVGIDVNRTVAMTFAIGSFLAAVAAPFYVIKYVPINNSMGYLAGILAFSSAVLGGIGNIRGAMLGGFTIGVIYNMVPMFEVTADWRLVKAFGWENWNPLAGISEWRLGVAYVFMIVVIVLRPQGLLGKAAAGKRA